MLCWLTESLLTSVSDTSTSWLSLVSPTHDTRYTASCFRHRIIIHSAFWITKSYRYDVPVRRTCTTYRYDVPAWRTGTTYRYVVPVRRNGMSYRYDVPVRRIGMTYRYVVYQHNVPVCRIGASYRYDVPVQRTSTSYRYVVPVRHTVTSYRYVVPVWRTGTTCVPARKALVVYIQWHLSSWFQQQNRICVYSLTFVTKAS